MKERRRLVRWGAVLLILCLFIAFTGSQLATVREVYAADEIAVTRTRAIGASESVKDRATVLESESDPVPGAVLVAEDDARSDDKAGVVMVTGARSGSASTEANDVDPKGSGANTPDPAAAQQSEQSSAVQLAGESSVEAQQRETTTTTDLAGQASVPQKSGQTMASDLSERSSADQRKEQSSVADQRTEQSSVADLQIEQSSAGVQQSRESSAAQPSEQTLVAPLMTATGQSLVFTASGLLPTGASLVVKELDSRETAGLRDKVSQLQSKFPVFAFDLKIMADSLSYEPDESIRVTVRGVPFQTFSALEAHHLPEVDAEDLPSLSVEDLAPETLPVAKHGQDISFDTNGFSVFYFTVDFTFQDTSYSIGGDSEGILLSKLLQELEVGHEIADVLDLSFEGEATQYVDLTPIMSQSTTAESRPTDWMLEPTGEPFTTEAILTVYFMDGTAARIKVTDDVIISGTLGRTRVNTSRTWRLQGEISQTGPVMIENGATLTIVTDGPATIKRASGWLGCSFEIKGQDCGLVINNDAKVTLDGGAIWSGAVSPYIGRGTENIGVRANYPVIECQGHLDLRNVDITNNEYYSILTGLVGFELARGAGIEFFKNQVPSSLQNVTISNCQATHLGSAIWFKDDQATSVGEMPVFTFNDVHVNGCFTSVSQTFGFGRTRDPGGTICTDLDSRVDLRMNGCRIDHNFSSDAGGGIYWIATGRAGGRASSLTMSGCDVSNNAAVGCAGGLYLGTSASISSCQFNNNTVLGELIYYDDASGSQERRENIGGGIYVSAYRTLDAIADPSQTPNASLELTLDRGTTVSGNSAVNGAGVGFDLDGSAPLGQVCHLKLSLEGATITGNKAMGDGGGVYFANLPSDIPANMNYSLFMKLDGGLVANNIADRKGGGIYVYDASLLGGEANGDPIVIRENRATDGGGIYIDDSPSESFANIHILQNTATQNGGGVYTEGTGGHIEAGTRIDGNTAKNGGGIYATGGARVILTDGIIARNVAQGSYQGQTAYGGEDPAMSGVGGGVFLKNASLDLRAVTRSSQIGLHSNIASFAADDVYGSGIGTAVSLPPLRGRKAAEYPPRIPATFIDWFEDYAETDSHYADGLNTAPSIGGHRYRTAPKEQRVATLLRGTSQDARYICLTAAVRYPYELRVNSLIISADEEADKEIHFTATILDGDHTFPAPSGSEYSLSNEGRTASFQLKSGESLSFEDLYEDLEVRITAELPDGYFVNTEARNVDQSTPIHNGRTVVLRNSNKEAIDVDFEFRSSFEMPVTGGTGTAIFLGAGLITMLVALGLMLRRMLGTTGGGEPR